MTYLIGFRSRLLQQEDFLAQLHEFPHCRYGEDPHSPRCCGIHREESLVSVLEVVIYSAMSAASWHQWGWLSVCRCNQQRG